MSQVSNDPVKPGSESRPRNRETGCIRSRELQTWRADRPDRGSLAPGSVRRPAATRQAANAPAPSLRGWLRSASSAPLPRGLVKSALRLFALRSREGGPRRSRRFGLSGNPTRELRILPQAAPAQQPEHELVPRMFPTNGALRSLVPPMQSNQLLSIVLVPIVFRALRARSFFAQISGEIRDGAQVHPASRRRTYLASRPQLACHWNWRKKLNNYLNI